MMRQYDVLFTSGDTLVLTTPVENEALAAAAVKLTAAGYGARSGWGTVQSVTLRKVIRSTP